MENLKKYFGVLILLGVIGGGAYTYFQKNMEYKGITYSTSDAKNLKGEISIALDSWIGYFPFRSPVFGQLMRDEGYRIKVIDDNADYSGRMKMLKKGKVDFAVCTVDSYLLNGHAVKFPGVIVTVIDQSKGGDAIVAWKNKISNIDFLKNFSGYKIAFTPSSPSEHLLKSIAVHFDIPRLKNKDDTWRVETKGSQEAYDFLMAKKTDCAVLWEPHVSEALAKNGIVKILGSEDIENLIVDILLVNRKFADTDPDLVKIFIKNYFKALEIYSASPARLAADIQSGLNLPEKQVKSMLKGVRWISYTENYSWFGLANQNSHTPPEIVKSINSTIGILTGSGDFKSNPLPDGDPYTVLNSSYIKNLYSADTAASLPADIQAGSVEKNFEPLSEEKWKKLKVVGSLKLRPITFRSGTSEIDESGKDQLKDIGDNLRHYPNFRILIKGHTGLLGDADENRKLSESRAAAVKSGLQASFNIDPDRIRVAGVGSKEPLARLDDESERGYNNRLKRVEILFLSEN